MSSDVWKMIITGVVFGVWPLLMNKSGLVGTTATATIAFIVMLLVLPVGVYHGLTFVGSKWWFAVIAGCFAALGMLMFNSMLAKATRDEVGRLFVIMLVFQTAVPAVYHAYVNGGLTLKSGAGFLTAIITVFLLS